MSPIKVAVIEDDHDLQFLYKMKLELVGFKVAVADDGQQGLALLEHFRPDIVLLDLMMPVMSGGEMLAELRSHAWGSGMRVIVLTNISKDEAPQALRFLHVDRYVVKASMTPSQVVDIIYEVLGKRPT